MLCSGTFPRSTYQITVMNCLSGPILNPFRNQSHINSSWEKVIVTTYLNQNMQISWNQNTYWHWAEFYRILPKLRKLGGFPLTDCLASCQVIKLCKGLQVAKIPSLVFSREELYAFTLLFLKQRQWLRSHTPLSGLQQCPSQDILVLKAACQLYIYIHSLPLTSTATSPLKGNVFQRDPSGKAAWPRTSTNRYKTELLVPRIFSHPTYISPLSLYTAFFSCQWHMILHFLTFAIAQKYCFSSSQWWV